MFPYAYYNPAILLFMESFSSFHPYWQLLADLWWKLLPIISTLSPYDVYQAFCLSTGCFNSVDPAQRPG